MSFEIVLFSSFENSVTHVPDSFDQVSSLEPESLPDIEGRGFPGDRR